LLVAHQSHRDGEGATLVPFDELAECSGISGPCTLDEDAVVIGIAGSYGRATARKFGGLLLHLIGRARLGVIHPRDNSITAAQSAPWRGGRASDA
jgi:hypothetical protein